MPADAVFHQGHEGRFDGVISLYHDQGHVASKTLDFFGTVSATLGLPVIRTSVDHGTAFDLAGKWKADARGQIAALRVGAQLAPGALRIYGLVVDSVNVSVLAYVPVRSGSLRPIVCLKPSVTESLETGPR